MSQITNKKTKINSQGFTLIELLMAIAIFGIISVISIQGLYDIVSIRAKQQTIEDSSDSFRTIARQVSKAITEADTVLLPDVETLTTKNNSECHTFKYDSVSGLVLHEVSFSDEAANIECKPPDTLTFDDSITSEDLKIDTFSVRKPDTDADTYILEITGSYKNSLGDHPINYSTTITKRI